MPKDKTISIAFVIDERLSNEKMGVLIRSIQLVNQNYGIEMIKGAEITEEKLISKLNTEKYSLIFLPLHRYFTWTRIDTVLGTNRFLGPNVAGYFCEPTPLNQLQMPKNQNRGIVLDLCHTTPQENLILIRSLLIESQRAGIRSLLEPTTTVYCESWYASQGQGSRMDAILGLPEVVQLDWVKRSSAIRIILSAFWGLIYEEGPGRNELSQGIAQESTAKVTKGYFQVSATAHCILFRIHFHTTPHQTPKEVLQHFWPDSSCPTKPAQLLLKYSDFLRVHPFQDSSDIEVVAGLLSSAPAEKKEGQIHTLWIEPLATKLLNEPPYEAPGPKSPNLKLLPTSGTPLQKPRLVESSAATHLLQEATGTIRDLKLKIKEREEKIQDLRAGGVGTATPLPPPEIEDLIEAFQRKYFDAKYQIRQFELELIKMEQSGGSPQEIETLRLKIDALTNREKAWIKSLMTTLEHYKKTIKNG